MADNVKGNYDAKFLEAIYFAFKKYNFSIVSKAGQLQAIHAVVTGNRRLLLNLKQDLATLFSTRVCYIAVPLICLGFSLFRV